jgi:hypothetical protein
MVGSRRCAHVSRRPTVILPDSRSQGSEKIAFREAASDTAAVAGETPSNDCDHAAGSGRSTSLDGVPLACIAWLRFSVAPRRRPAVPSGRRLPCGRLFLRLHHVTRSPRPRPEPWPSRRTLAREPIFSFSSPPAIRLALRSTLSSRAIPAPVDAADGRSVFSWPSGMTLDQRRAPSRRQAAGRPRCAGVHDSSCGPAAEFRRGCGNGIRDTR